MSFRVVVLTLLTLLAFAGNSLLCRAALRGGASDPASFTIVRLLSGALVLSLLAARGRRASGARAGSWLSAACLFTYAAAFSFSYQRVQTGMGALLLFGAVQVTMIGWGVVRGARPSLLQWLGLVVAAAGLVVLTRPGRSAPDVWGAVLMALAGVAWGAYSLRGKRATRPLAETAGNFVRSLAGAVILLAATGFTATGFSFQARLTLEGVLLATCSGAVTSGMGYALWFRVLPRIGAWTASVAQLFVPPLAALAGVVLLGESLTSRLVLATTAIVLGIGLSLVPSKR